MNIIKAMYLIATISTMLFKKIINILIPFTISLLGIEPKINNTVKISVTFFSFQTCYLLLLHGYNFNDLQNEINLYYELFQALKVHEFITIMHLKIK